MEPMTPPIISPEQAPAASKKMAVIWIVVAVAVLVGIGWYYFFYFIPLPSVPSGPDEATTKLEQQSSSDEVSAIEQDLGATDLGDLDKELGDIDAVLSQ